MGPKSDNNGPFSDRCPSVGWQKSIMLHRLNAIAWLLSSFLLLLLCSCKQFDRAVDQTEPHSSTDRTNSLSSPTPVELIATPTLRPRSASTSPEPEQQPTIESRSVLLNNKAGELDNLRGVGRLVGLTTCTASLIEINQEPDAPAYVLTAGRCVQPRLANAVYLNGLVGNMHVLFNFFADTQEEQLIVLAKNVVYSTMKGRDLAIVELEETVGGLKEKGIEPLPFSGDLIEDTLPISMIGAPAVGFSPDSSFLRMEKCVLDGQVDLVESQLFAYDVYRTDCQDNFSGSAGSPLFADGDYVLLGINSATTVAGFHPCSLGAPCEVTEQTTVMRDNASYATPLTGLAECFNQEGRFDISLQDCLLDDDRQLRLSNSIGEVTQSMQIAADGEKSPVRWNITASGDYSYYRYKIGPISQTNCRDVDGYSEVYLLGEDTVINQQVSSEEGFEVLCVLGGDSRSPSDKEMWQSPEFATKVLVKIDNTPPTLDPIVVLVHDGEFYSVYFHLDPPELNYYEYKVDALSETDCHDTVDYDLVPRGPLQIPKNQTQYSLCVIGIDAAGNKAQPYEIILGGEQSAVP